MSSDSYRKCKAYRAALYLTQIIIKDYPHLKGASIDEILDRLAPCRHSDDYRSVRWFGLSYTFTPGQAAVVSVLWTEWERGTPKVGAGPLLHAADLVSDKVSVLFRGHEAWGSMIQTDNNGMYWLEECPVMGGKMAIKRKDWPDECPFLSKDDCGKCKDSQKPT